MKIEKISENKIRIILNLEDLKEKNIDFHSFMSNPIESQSLFLDMLHVAEKEVGFITKDYKVAIEALATPDGNFVLTVTRSLEDSIKPSKKKVHIKRKSFDCSKESLIYSFVSFDDVCLFCESIKSNHNYDNFSYSDTNSLYEYKNKYYLCFDNLCTTFNNLKGFCSVLTEFGSYVDFSELFKRKLMEHGSLIISNNAIKTIIDHFSVRWYAFVE